MVIEGREHGREHGRERNKRATRRALRAATLDLGLEHGLAGVSIDQIAARAGVSPRTFFNYFDAKEDAALIELFMITDDELAAFAAPPPTGAWADLGRMFVADVERAERDGEDFSAYLSLHARDPMLGARQLGHFSLFLGRLDDAVVGRLGGGPAGRTRAEVMAGSCITAVRVGLHRWVSEGATGSAAPHISAAFAAFDGAFREGDEPPSS